MGFFAKVDYGVDACGDSESVRLLGFWLKRENRDVYLPARPKAGVRKPKRKLTPSLDHPPALIKVPQTSSLLALSPDASSTTRMDGKNST